MANPNPNAFLRDPVLKTKAQKRRFRKNVALHRKRAQSAMQFRTNQAGPSSDTRPVSIPATGFAGEPTALMRTGNANPTYSPMSSDVEDNTGFTSTAPFDRSGKATSGTQPEQLMSTMGSTAGSTSGRHSEGGDTSPRQKRRRVDRRRLDFDSEPSNNGSGDDSGSVDSAIFRSPTRRRSRRSRSPSRTRRSRSPSHARRSTRSGSVLANLRGSPRYNLREREHDDEITADMRKPLGNRELRWAPRYVHHMTDFENHRIYHERFARQSYNLFRFAMDNWRDYHDYDLSDKVREGRIVAAADILRTKYVALLVKHDQIA